VRGEPKKLRIGMKLLFEPLCVYWVVDPVLETGGTMHGQESGMNQLVMKGFQADAIWLQDSIALLDLLPGNVCRFRDGLRLASLTLNGVWQRRRWYESFGLRGGKLQGESPGVDRSQTV
jgi:hypothetical protein